MKKWFVLVLVFFLLESCQLTKRTNEAYVKLEGRAQGTTYAITYRGKPSLFSSVQADSVFRLIDSSMSLWDKNSLISQFNHTNETLEVDEHFVRVLQKAFHIYEESEGAFDPTIAPFLKVWGFERKTSNRPPTQQTLDSLSESVGLHWLLLDNNHVVKRKPNVQLDFNAIAQGYTVDVLAACLEKNGVVDYLIEVGGEVRAKGYNARGLPWRIAIEQPVSNESDEMNEFQHILMLPNKSIATSGSYRNFLEVDGKKLGHIIHPKTGQSIDNQVVSVTVVAPTCMEADAWATAFMVLGKEKSAEIASRKGLDFQLVSFINSSFVTYQSPHFSQYVISKKSIKK